MALNNLQCRHAGHCWRSRDELISDVLLWTPTYGRAKAGWPARTYIQQLCEDTGWSPEELPGAMNDREKWLERVRDIRASCTTWWWWWLVCLKTEQTSLNKLITVSKLCILDTRNKVNVPRWNGYCRGIRTGRPKFKSWTRLLAFRLLLIPFRKSLTQLFSLQLWVNSRADFISLVRQPV